MKEVGKNGVLKLIQNLKKIEKEGYIEARVEPFIMPLVIEKYQGLLVDKFEKRPARLKKYFSYSILRKKCNRHLYYYFTEYPTLVVMDAGIRLNMDVGTWIHKLYEEYLFPLAKVVPKNYKESFIRCEINGIPMIMKPDFKLEFNNEERTIDIKTLDKYKWNSFKRNPVKFLRDNYSGRGIYLQAQFYMLVTGVDNHTIIAHNRDDSKIVEITICRSENYINKLLKRCKEIWDNIQDKEIPKKAYFDKEQCKKEYCEYIEICWKKKDNKKLEKELVKGYKAKAKLNLKICDDFKFVNGENLGEK